MADVCERNKRLEVSIEITEKQTFSISDPIKLTRKS